MLEPLAALLARLALGGAGRGVRRRLHRGADRPGRRLRPLLLAQRGREDRPGQRQQRERDRRRERRRRRTLLAAPGGAARIGVALRRRGGRGRGAGALGRRHHRRTSPSDGRRLPTAAAAAPSHRRRRAGGVVRRPDGRRLTAAVFAARLAGGSDGATSRLIRCYVECERRARRRRARPRFARRRRREVRVGRRPRRRGLLLVAARCSGRGRGGFGARRWWRAARRRALRRGRRLRHVVEGEASASGGRHMTGAERSANADGW